MKATRRRWPWILGGILAVIVVLVLSFDAIVEWQTRRALSSLEAYTATVGKVKLRPFKLTYALSDLRVVKKSAGDAKEPVLTVDALEVGLYWKELVRGRLVTRLEVDGVKSHLIAAKEKKEQQLAPEEPNLAEKLDKIFPIKVDRIQVKNAEVLFIDKTEKDFPKIWLHDLDATVENFATRAALAKGQPTIVAVSGTLQKTGELSLYLTADPLAKGLYASGSAQLKGLQLKEFYEVISSKSGLHLKQGTLDVFAQFDMRDGHLSGGVKPIIKNPEVVQGKPGLGNKIKAVLADAALSIFSDRVGDRDAVATVIPIDGKITKPEAQLWPTVFGIIRNAFVAGVSEGFERLPPPKAKEKENLITQAGRMVAPGDPPKAQPAGNGKKD